MRFTEVPLVLDTLWADMDREKLTLVWRGNTVIQSEEFEEVRHAFFMSEPLDGEPASFATCRDAFMAALAEEGEGFALEAPPAPGAGTVEPAVAAEAAAVAPETGAAKIPMAETTEGAPPPADPAAIKNQAITILTQAGINLDTLPPDVKNRIDSEMDRVINRMKEKDPSKILEEQRANLDASLSAALAKAGLDAGNLTPMSGKARQEQIRMLRELGLDNPEMALDDPGFSSIFNAMVALYPKLGIDPENISPMIQRTKEHVQRMSGGFNSIAGSNQPPKERS